MRIDTSIIEPLMDAAQLSPREREAMRLMCAGADNAELGRALGVKRSTAAVFKHDARRKMAPHVDAFVATLKAKTGPLTSDYEAEWYADLLEVMRHFRPTPGPLLIGLTHTEDVDGIAVTISLTGAAHAGALITVDDLLGVPLQRTSARWNRQRISEEDEEERAA